MLLFFSLLLISRILTSYSDFVEEKKFINDLKGEEKQEFIDRVVRRLAEEVNLKDVPKEESRKIPDDQLDEHNDFVKKIINEEKTQFDKEAKDKKQAEVSRRHANQSHIDLTLKEQTRKQRQEVLNENKNIKTTEANEVTVPVQVVFDADTNKSSENPVTTTTASTNDIKVEGHRLKLRRSALKEDRIETESTTTYLDNGNTTIFSSDKSKQSNEVTSSTDAPDEETTVKSSEKSSENDENTTKVTAAKKDNKRSKNIDEDKVEATVDKEELSDQNKVLKESNIDSKGSDEEYLKESDSALRTVNVTTDQAATKNAIDKNKLHDATEKQAVRDGPLEQSTAFPEALSTYSATTQEPKLESTSKKVLGMDDDTNRNKINDLTLTYNPLHNPYKSDVNRTRTSKLSSVKIVKVGPSNDNILRSISTVHNKDIFDRRNSSEINEQMKTLQIAENVMKALRIGIDRDTKNKKLALRTTTKNKRKKDKDKKDTAKEKRKKRLRPKEVDIYGLRSFVEDKSEERQDMNREEPYYAPIYNFDPNNAYYNAHNKFGPNYDDNRENRANEAQQTIDLQELLNLQKYVGRSFYHKPIKHPINRKSKSTRLKNSFNERILPFIANNPLNEVPQNDYEELFGDRDDYNNRKVYRSDNNRINEEGQSLKEFLRNIRKTLHSKKENKLYITDFKSNKGWLDDDVKYYLENLNRKHVGKAKQKMHKNNYQFLNYDLGEITDKTNSVLKNFDLLPTATSQLNSREVITQIKKGKEVEIEKDIESKDIVETFQKVYPLLKNLVQIVDDDVDKEVEACIKVMRDMIDRNDEGLEQYDWLESTVNIQTAIKKLLDLSRAATEGLVMHPADVELLQFTTYIFALGSRDLQNGAESFPTTQYKSPKSNKKFGHYANHKQLFDGSNNRLHRVPWPKKSYTFEYEAFRRFLNELSDSLFDLHDALKHVSLVTRFQSQRWFGNLKDLYLHDPDRLKLLQVILHLGTTRLFNLIEDTTSAGLDHDFRRYIQENQTTASGIKDALVFVLKVLQAAVYERGR